MDEVLSENAKTCGSIGVAMPSGKALFGAVMGRFLFREVRTTAVRDLGPTFRLLTFAGETIRYASWEAGDKIQVFIPGKGMRTYTPMTWDAERGSAELLVYLHSERSTAPSLRSSPGTAWGRRLTVGDGWQFFGPRRSVRGTDLGRNVVLFGDETSFGVARALSDAKGPSSVRCVFEVDDESASKVALSAIGLIDATTIRRQPSDGHLGATCDALTKQLEAEPAASLVMTGRAQSIQRLRARLRAKDALRAGKVKAYWSVGKTGLD